LAFKWINLGEKPKPTTKPKETTCKRYHNSLVCYYSRPCNDDAHNKYRFQDYVFSNYHKELEKFQALLQDKKLEEASEFLNEFEKYSDSDDIFLIHRKDAGLKAVLRMALANNFKDYAEAHEASSVKIEQPIMRKKIDQNINKTQKKSKKQLKQPKQQQRPCCPDLLAMAKDIWRGLEFFC
jgi:hypothetical protein